MMPNYYYGMSDDYYKYFSKLAARGGQRLSDAGRPGGTRGEGMRDGRKAP